jgi:hypothetical protein
MAACSRLAMPARTRCAALVWIDLLEPMAEEIARVQRVTKLGRISDVMSCIRETQVVVGRIAPYVERMAAQRVRIGGQVSVSERHRSVGITRYLGFRRAFAGMTK